MKTFISDIKRFAVHDGDGIRTTVFFKGCPLKCLWCHNPEGIAAMPEMAYYAGKCAGCGECVKICPRMAHKIKDGEHVFERNLCTACGMCEGVCPRNALKLYGKEYTAREIMPILTQDKMFYDNSGGGVTLSGGECLIHSEFCAELLKMLHEKNIHTAVDTCGFVPKEAFDRVMPYTDIFLYDIKAIDEDTHIKCTGHSNRIILENLKYIDRCGKKTEIRIPYVPGYNSEEKKKILEFISGLKNVTKIRVLAYHNYAGSKYAALGMKNTLPGILPGEDDIEEFQNEANGIIKKN